MFFLSPILKDSFQGYGVSQKKYAVFLRLWIEMQCLSGKLTRELTAKEELAFTQWWIFLSPRRQFDKFDKTSLNVFTNIKNSDIIEVPHNSINNFYRITLYFFRGFYNYTVFHSSIMDLAKMRFPLGE